jgi:hypothetical protein
VSWQISIAIPEAPMKAAAQHHIPFRRQKQTCGDFYRAGPRIEAG